MMELNLSRVDFCQVATTSQKCMHLLPAAGRKDPLQKVGAGLSIYLTISSTTSKLAGCRPIGDLEYSLLVV